MAKKTDNRPGSWGTVKPTARAKSYAKNLKQFENTQGKGPGSNRRRKNTGRLTGGGF